STAGAAPGTITVTCNVVDDKGQTASSTTTVTVNAPPPPPAPTASALCTVNFERDKRRPTRVDNEGKACLDDVALNLQRSSDAKLAVTGNAASKERMGSKVAAARAINTKEYLVKEKGIDASRISVYTGSQDGKTVTTTLIPAGATLDSTGITAVDESAVAVKPRGRRAAHHKAK
ncbi:MAG: OmpA family protein, partial [Edaphobacter sp.]